MTRHLDEIALWVAVTALGAFTLRLVVLAIQGATTP